MCKIWRLFFLFLYFSIVYDRRQRTEINSVYVVGCSDCVIIHSVSFVFSKCDSKSLIELKSSLIQRQVIPHLG